MKVFRLLVCFGLLGVGANAVARPEGDALSGLAVPVDVPSEQRDAAVRVMKAVLADYRGQAARQPEFVVTASGQGVLYGDLFKTGRCFALVELAEQNDEDPDASGVAFAEWTGGSWQLRGLWDIPVTWRPQGWKPSGDDYLPVVPATQPFLLEDLSGDSVPEVVFAGVVNKYYQENFLFRFVPQVGNLNLVAWAMARPEKVEEYVRLYTNSGRRAIWEEWEFCRWKGDELKLVASWHGETGYNENDPTYCEGSRFGPGGVSTTIRILYGQGQESDDGGYKVTRNGKTFGTLHVVWKDGENRFPEEADSESAWLFEKTTGLPRRLFPGTDNAASLARFEEVARVTVDGSDESARFFGSGR